MDDVKKTNYDIKKKLFDLLLTEQYNLNFLNSYDFTNLENPNYNLDEFLQHVDENRLPYLYTGIEIILSEDMVDKNSFIENLTRYKATRKKLEGSLGHVEYHKDFMIINTSDKKLSTVVHELNHFASSIFKNNHFGLSFKYRTKNLLKKHTTVSRGLDEGMTEFITYNQLKDRDYLKGYYPVYSFNFQYAACLSKIIGYENLKDYYYKKDIKDLYKEIRKYVSKDEFYGFLRDSDYLLKNVERSDVNSFNRSKVINTIERCNNFFINLSEKKYGINIVYNDIVNKVDEVNFIPMQAYDIARKNAVRKDK